MQKRTAQQLSSRSTTGEKNPRTTQTRGRRQATPARAEGKQSPRRRTAAARSSLECPQCGGELQQRVVHGVPIDECSKCRGVWLDKETVAQASRTGGEQWVGQLVVDLASLISHPSPVQPKEGTKWYWY